MTFMFSFPEALNSANRTKSMTDFVSIESIFGHHLISREEIHLTCRNKREEKAFSLAMRTVTFEDWFREIEIDGVLYRTAVTASCIFHHVNFMYEKVNISF
jgi:hypothetical protein